MNRHDRFFTEPGTSKKILYSPVVQDDGTIVLVESGVVDTDEVMEIEAQSCSLENILSRYANGDLDALNRFEPIYADVSDFPKTYAEFLQHAINAENGFHRLPKDIQDKYGNSWERWLMDTGSEDWIHTMSVLSNKSDFQDPSASQEKGEVSDEQEH